MASRYAPSIITNDARCLLLKDKIQDYLNYYCTGCWNTVRARAKDMNYFLDFVEGRFSSPLLGDVTFADICGFRDYRLLTLEEAPATVSRRLSNVKHFFRCMSRWYPELVDPAREVKCPHVDNKAPRSLLPTDEGAIRYLAFTDRHASFRNFRRYFLIELFLETGLRVEEVRDLRLEQVDRARMLLLKVKTKGTKILDKPYSDRLAKIIDEYLEVREEFLNGLHDRHGIPKPKDLGKYPLLLSAWGFRADDPASYRMSAKAIWRAVADLASEARVKHYSPHQYRHTFAHGLLESSKDIVLVAQALGHSDVRTTMRYLMSKEEKIRAALNQRNIKEAA